MLDSYKIEYQSKHTHLFFSFLWINIISQLSIINYFEHIEICKSFELNKFVKQFHDGSNKYH